MDDGTVRIHELRLRAPGLSAEEGRVLGNEVVRFLSEALCEGIRYREVAALEVKVNIPAGVGIFWGSEMMQKQLKQNGQDAWQQTSGKVISQELRPALRDPRYGLGNQPVLSNHGTLSRAGLPVQMKLAVSSPNDFYEQEADRVAEEKMTDTAPALYSDGHMSDNLLPIEKGSLTPRESIQRKSNGDQEEETFEETDPSEEEVLQTKSVPGESAQPYPDLSRSLHQSRGRGQPLSEETRNFVEGRFGVDFGHVRAHTDHEAALFTRALGARAFTYKSDIYFGAGEYGPDTRSGRLLLAHELTHVIQQSDQVKRKTQGPVISGVSKATGGVIQRSEALYFSTLGRQAYFRHAERFHRERGFPAPVRVGSVEEMLEHMATLSRPISLVRIVTHAVPAGIFLPLLRGGSSSLFQGDMALQSMESLERELGTSHPTVRHDREYQVEEFTYHLAPEDWVRQAWLAINWTRGGADVLIEHRFLLGDAPRATPRGPLPNLEMYSFLWWLLDRELLGAQRELPGRRGRTTRRYVIEMGQRNRQRLQDMYESNITIFRNRLIPHWGQRESFDRLEAMVVRVAPALIDRALEDGISVTYSMPEERYASVQGAVERGTYANNLLSTRFRLANGADFQIRGCNIGQNVEWLETFRDFFGHGVEESRSRPHVSAPRLRHFFGVRTRREGRRRIEETFEGLQAGRRRIYADNPQFDLNFEHVR